MPRSRRYFDSQPQPVIDVTRLVARLMKGRLPTGVDRVCLTYVQRYANRARAALHRGRFNIILPGAASRQLFALLLEPPRNLTVRVVALVAKAALFAWRDRSCAGSMLLTIEPRKNHWMILQVWRRLVELHGAAAPRLVIVGQRGWECENVLDLLERCESLRGFVLEKPVCSDSELVTYLRHAQALLFPSFVEGYGLPLAEALSLGVPAIASDLPVFREIAADIPEYLDPLDALGWLRCIESFCQPDSPLRESQLLKMSRFIPPAWAKHFETFEGLLRQV